MAALAGVLLFALGIAFSIGLHEVGHLLPAKRFGVKVTQYMIGFGPTLWSRTKGDTEYGIKAIPLGGYIRMVGMFPPARPDRAQEPRGPLGRLIADARRNSADEVGPGDDDRVFWKLPVRQKVVVMMGGPTMNLFLAAVFFTIALSGLGTPTLTTTVDTVQKCIVAVPTTSTAPPTCPDGAPASPAIAAGLRSGDTIVSVDGRPTPDWETLVLAIRSSGPGTTHLVVDRNSKQINLSADLVTTTRIDALNPDRTITAPVLGVTPSLVQQTEPLSSVPGRMWDFTARSAQAVVGIPARMVGVWQAAFDNAPRDPNGPVSIVGIGRVSAQVADTSDSLRWKAANFLSILASLNLALFLFNLVPLLPLDGGHVAGALYEGARRQLAKLRRHPDPGPVDVARLLPVAYTVAVLLIGMSALLMYADVVAPINFGG